MCSLPDWTLFLDSSGRLGDSEGNAVVAGLLVHATISDARNEAVLKQVGHLAPAPLWPWRAAELHVPVSIALGTLVELEEVRSQEDAKLSFVAGRLAEESELIGRACLEQAEREWKGSLERVRRRGRLCPDELRTLHQSALIGAREAYRRARYASLEFRKGMKASLSAIADEGGTREDWPLAMVVAAGESIDGDGGLTPFGKDGPQGRYRGLLACALERAAAVLARRGRAEHLHVEVVEREEPSRAQDGCPDGRLDGPVVGEVYERVTRGVAGAPPLACDPCVAEPGPSQGPQLVLANYVADRVRATVAANRPLSMTLRALEDALALPARSGSPEARSHLAATGEAWCGQCKTWKAPHAGTVHGWRGRFVPEKTRTRVWAIEQALQWA